ncbi:protein phosphatase 2C domain-containing protein [Pontibacillus marinus]|uniref:PPM-type phosphatase domain-containing protein n=1 Tax=Pontibacillus marinus BH030004 = DSM 16465 TaxID=1385511 RepID=A0A0A5G0Q0_9BACI|nr:protein phosphatase 2C domain-containing protein [Pontibacillus marinus]KGX85609.1 hypothetical protein N783_14035 [Pontibacillus marinus BH030004 = DSM 16465]
MKIESLTYKGVGELNEDSLIINDEMALYGVADGVSSLVPFKSDDNLTGGYIASNEVKRYFEHLHQINHLSEDLFVINRNLREKMEENGIDMVKKEQLWGTALAQVRVNENGVEFIQTGDCMILAVYQDDHVRPLTHLQTEHLESKVLNRWKELVHNGVNNRDDLMKEVKDTLVSNRMKSNTPEGYGVLNGEEDAIHYTEYGKINKIGLKYLILITDGLFLPSESVPAAENYWGYVAQSLLHKGLEQYANDLIELEESDPECLKYPRFKKSDDKAGLVITF